MASERRTLDDLHPRVRTVVKAVLADLAAEKLPFEIFEAYRTPQRQHALFQQGSVTKADAWQSYHQYGLAVDLVFKDKNGWSWDTSGNRLAMWNRMNAIGRKHGLEPLSWEKPHLQLAGIQLADLRAGRYPDGGDESWAATLSEAIECFPRGAPPLPQIGATRPPIALPVDVPEPDVRPVPNALANPNVSRETFELAQAIIKQYEGGFTNNPADPGGPTNWGITHTTLARWRGVGAVSVEDVRTMSYEEAKNIYFAHYWNPLQCGALPAPLALAIYNIGIHCGLKVAADFLQDAVIAQGVRIAHDLDIGPETVRGVMRCEVSRLLRSVIDDYEARLRAHTRFDVFGNGFMNRVRLLRHECDAWMAQSPSPPPKEIPPMPNPVPAEEVLPLLNRLLELLRNQSQSPNTPLLPPAQPTTLDPVVLAMIRSVLDTLAGRTQGNTAGQGMSPLGPVNNALGNGLGQLLNGRKSAIGIVGSMVLGIVQQSAPDGIANKIATVITSAAPVLAGASGPLMPVFLGMAAWGLLGKLEKYQGLSQPKK